MEYNIQKTVHYICSYLNQLNHRYKRAKITQSEPFEYGKRFPRTDKIKEKQTG